MVKHIADKLEAPSHSYPLDPIPTPFRSSPAVMGEEVLQKLKPWLSPPDPLINYTTGLRNQCEETANWFFRRHIFQEWHSTGSLLWIHGKRAFLETSAVICLSLTIPAIIAGSGKTILWFAVSLIAHYTVA
jgi:hypothetical protein